ncbi:M14 family metallopeptidase [Singulisphaera rosea]
MPNDGHASRSGRRARASHETRPTRSRTSLHRKRLSPTWSLVFVLFLLGTGRAKGGEVPSPESHLGFRAGADFHLAPWSKVVDYFREVDEASDRVSVRELGRTTEDRPYLVAAVAAPETLRSVAKYQDIQRRLTDPRLLASPAETADLVAAGKTVVVISCSIHSNEAASTLMAMELLHELATRDDPITREILGSTILLLVPSANPDGVDKVAKWYERSKGHPWEGSGMPELYHAYAGHDTNRDWFMLNLKETRLLTHLLYREWFPTILYDVHQMGTRGARIFVPPFHDPVNPNIDRRIHQSIAMLGAHMAADLATAGKPGVLTNAMYDNWWNGGNRTTPQRHNIVAILTEAASVRMGTPIFLEKDELRGGSRGFRDHAAAANFVEPWAGGWWRLRDIVDYELICARSLLSLAARYRTHFQSNLQAMGQEAIALGKSSPPFGWVVPNDTQDPGTAAEMVRILHETGIEVERVTENFQAGGVTFPAGSWILPAAQPYRAHLKDMLESQAYPSRFNGKGEAEAPYDVAGWTLPLQMGVRTVAVAEPFRVEAKSLERIDPLRGRRTGAEKPTYWTIANRSNDDFIALNALVDAGVDVQQVIRGPADQTGFVVISKEEAETPLGTLGFPANEMTRSVLDRVFTQISTNVVGREGTWPGSRTTRRLRPARVGVYQPWVPSMDEGWTRWVLERFRFKYTTLHNSDIRVGRLRDRVETLLLPSIEPKPLRDGFQAGQTEPRFEGGLGREGVEALRAFVTEGGTLVCLEDSCNFAIEELGLPVVNVLKNLDTPSFFGPGSILSLRKTSGDHPLTFGVPDKVSGYFDRSLAFEPNPKDGAHSGVETVLTYANENVLESGWLLGPSHVQGKAALVVVPLGKGSVVLFGFPPQHRGQTHGTFRLLFNALLAGGERDRRSPESSLPTTPEEKADHTKPGAGGHAEAR